MKPWPRRSSYVLSALVACACSVHQPSSAATTEAPAAATPPSEAPPATAPMAPTAPTAPAVPAVPAPVAVDTVAVPAPEVDLGPVAEWYAKTSRRARLNQAASAADLSFAVNLIDYVLHGSDAVWARMEPTVEAAYRAGGTRLQLAFTEIDAATAAEYHKAGTPLTSLPKEERDGAAEERIFAKGLLLEPTSADFYHHLAVAATLRNDPKTAERYGKLAIAIDPNFIGAYQELAYIYKNTERYDDAVAIADRGVLVDGDIRTKALLLARKGQALWMQSKQEEALSAFRRSQRLGGPSWVASYLDGRQVLGKVFETPPEAPAAPAAPVGNE